MQLRLLARAAPFVLGAVAAAVWRRRRRPEGPAPPAKTGRVEHSSERPPVDILTVVDDLLGAAR